MGRVYGGQSAQQRTDARRRQFLDAGLEILGTRGWANTTVRAICDEAGLSTRFFYEGFDSLEELARELYEETVGTTLSAVFEAVTTADDDREAQARAAVTALVTSLTDDPRRARVALAHAFDNPAIGPRRREMMGHMAEVVAAFGRVGYQTPRTAEPFVRVAATMVAGGLVELMLAYAESELDLTREELIDSCSRLLIGLGDSAQAFAR